MNRLIILIILVLLLVVAYLFHPNEEDDVNGIKSRMKNKQRLEMIAIDDKISRANTTKNSLDALRIKKQDEFNNAISRIEKNVLENTRDLDDVETSLQQTLDSIDTCVVEEGVCNNELKKDIQDEIEHVRSEKVKVKNGKKHKINELEKVKDIDMNQIDVGLKNLEKSQTELFAEKEHLKLKHKIDLLLMDLYGNELNDLAMDRLKKSLDAIGASTFHLCKIARNKDHVHQDLAKRVLKHFMKNSMM